MTRINPNTLSAFSFLNSFSFRIIVKDSGVMVTIGVGMEVQWTVRKTVCIAVTVVVIFSVAIALAVAEPLRNYSKKLTKMEMVIFKWMNLKVDRYLPIVFFTRGTFTHRIFTRAKNTRGEILTKNDL